MTNKKESAGLRLAIDYAPLLVFVAITFFAPNAPLMKRVTVNCSTLVAKVPAKVARPSSTMQTSSRGFRPNRSAKGLTPNAPTACPTVWAA